jgi:hypothetical protein
MEQQKVSGQGETMEIDGIEVPLDAQFPVDIDGHTVLVPNLEYVEDVLGGLDE